MDILKNNQWGTIPRRSSETVGTMYNLIIENHILSLQPLCIFQNDATACYDKIIHTLSSICNKKYNVSSKLCNLQTKTLKYINILLKLYFKNIKNIVAILTILLYTAQDKDQEPQEQTGPL